LTDGEGNATGEAVAVTPDGKTIVGFTFDNPYIWNATDGYTMITHPNPDYYGGAVAVTDDGKTVVGYFRPFGPALLGEGFIYTKENGRINLNDYVASLGYDNLGFNFSLPLGISPNGKYIVGIGIKDDDAIGFVIKLPGNLATGNSQATNKLSVYPNPVESTLFIKNADKNASVEIYNMAGQKVISSSAVSTSGLDVSKLTKGAYVVKVKTGTSTESIKIIKK